MAFASLSGETLVSCLSRVVTPLATYVWPQVIYDNSVPLDEYLFDRRSLSLGAGFIQTSSFLLPRQLFDKVRFNVDSPHDDWELVLRLSKELGIKIETVPEVLAILYLEEERSSLSRSRNLVGFSEMDREHATDHHAAGLWCFLSWSRGLSGSEGT